MLKAKKRLTRKEIKQDKLVTYYFKSIELYDAHKREVLYFIVGLVAVVLLALYIINSKKQAEQEASVQLDIGKAAFESNNFDTAIDVLTPLVENFSGTTSAGVGSVFLAKSFATTKKYDQAEKYFSLYLDDYGDDPILSVAAASGLAASFDDRGDYAKAAELYEKAASDYKDSYKAPELLIASARCYQLAKNAEAAKRVLNKVIEAYPESQVVAEAKMQLAELES